MSTSTAQRAAASSSATVTVQVRPSSESAPRVARARAASEVGCSRTAKVASREASPIWKGSTRQSRASKSASTW